MAGRQTARPAQTLHRFIPTELPSKQGERDSQPARLSLARPDPRRFTGASCVHARLLLGAPLAVTGQKRPRAQFAHFPFCHKRRDEAQGPAPTVLASACLSRVQVRAAEAAEAADNPDPQAPLSHPGRHSSREAAGAAAGGAAGAAAVRPQHHRSYRSASPEHYACAAYR